MRKAIFLLLSIFSWLLSGCSTKFEIKEVYIPTKCDIPERIKPKRESFSDYTEFSAHLRAYYKNIESDLAFCRTGKSENERIKAPP